MSSWKRLEITDYRKDTGYCRFAAYSGGDLVIRTNDPRELAQAVKDFFTDDECTVSLPEKKHCDVCRKRDGCPYLMNTRPKVMVDV
jgi:hypothetical protein